MFPCSAQASHCGGFSCFRAQALKHGLQQLWHAGLVAPRHLGSSQTRCRTDVPSIVRRILSQWTIREAAFFTILAPGSGYQFFTLSKEECPYCWSHLWNKICTLITGDLAPEIFLYWIHPLSKASGKNHCHSSQPQVPHGNYRDWGIDLERNTICDYRI